MSSPHIEVVPRIIDSSIAAAYQTPPKASTESKKEVPTQVSEAVSASAAVINVVPRTFTEKFFSTLKDYLIPIVFVIAVIVIIYILWTYWTKYRIKPDVPSAATDTTKQDNIINPPEDLSKYILNIDDSSETDSNHDGSVTTNTNDKLSVIEEGSESYDSPDNDDSTPSLENEQEEENADEENADEENADEENADEENADEENAEENDVESVISEPDFSVISNLINQSISEYANDRFEYLDDSMSLTGMPEDDTISLANSIHTEIDTDEMHMNEPLESSVKVSKRVKKPKRMVL